jgi:Ni/Fe-hydrogenase subunit HybB-like protein
MNIGRQMTHARRWPELSFWRLIFLILAAVGAVAAALRFTRGLGAATNLSDQFPWGLWIGFDVLCGVGLAAGGFTITAAVYIFNLKRFTPIIRPTVLTAFLGYLFVIFALLFDLGQPHRIWHALVMWNPRSVMFEVAWCVMLYTTVLALEFSPIVFERLNLERPRRIVRAVSVPLVIVGVILSTLHQSSLGSLYLIVPEKLHPLWYSPLLPVFFFVSAVAAGLAMVIVESYLCQRAFTHHLEMDLLEPLGRAMVVVLSVYGILRLHDVARRGALAGLWRPDYEGSMFLLEIGLGVLLPIVLLAIPRVRAKQSGLVTGAFLAVLGFVMHRLNVSVTGMERASGVTYFPSWMEFAVSLALVAAGFAFFGLAVQHLPIFPEAAHRLQAGEAPAWLTARLVPTIAGGGAPPAGHEGGRALSPASPVRR